MAYNCAECGKEFFLQYQLELHHIDHHMPYPCPKNNCNKGFCSLAALEYHTALAHKSKKHTAAEYPAPVEPPSAEPPSVEPPSVEPPSVEPPSVGPFKHAITHPTTIDAALFYNVAAPRGASTKSGRKCEKGVQEQGQPGELVSLYATMLFILRSSAG
ncbi:hypothetical protein BGZ63DRAFT_452226 [Mariannaea sp. PMI_226]|nr:hypothetical protein BGZ63DRAFT_452226 [Mariannaea sp. PMI_226]